MQDLVIVSGLPLRWLVSPVRSELDDGRLAIEVGAGTDWFVDPSGERPPVTNAPALVGNATGDYLLTARVTVEFRSAFDAGALMLHVNDRLWAKLCFEYSPQEEPMIVSVVTDGRSDDANAFVVAGNEAWLRIARIGSAFAFHASLDGRTWRLVRHFTLGEGAEPTVGFEAQSPTGTGCVVTFDEVAFEPARLDDLRSGA
jgi:regulation of enolase protein 1 (concanavalin A-like superfamily)